MGIAEPPIVPMPPHSATGMARAEVDTRIDMPPWMSGTGAVKGPMVSGGNFIFVYSSENSYRTRKLTPNTDSEY
jgi:hypothetical protein